MKKWWALLLSVCLIASLAACGKNAEEETKEKEATESSEETSEDPSEESSSEEETKTIGEESSEETTPGNTIENEPEEPETDPSLSGEWRLSATLYGEYKEGGMFASEAEYQNAVELSGAVVKKLVLNAEKNAFEITASWCCFEDDTNSSYTDIPEGTKTFVFNSKTVFEAGGGDSEPQVLTPEEFAELAQNYNGLGLSLRVKDGIIIKAGIYS